VTAVPVSVRRRMVPGPQSRTTTELPVVIRTAQALRFKAGTQVPDPRMVTRVEVSLFIFRGVRRFGFPGTFFNAADDPERHLGDISHIHHLFQNRIGDFRPGHVFVAAR